jgi:primosomal protein N'
MKGFFHPVGLIMLAIAGAGAVMSQATVLALGVVGYLFVLAFQSLRPNPQTRSQDLLNEVSNLNRARIAPLRRSAREIEEIGRKMGRGPLSTLAKEAEAESARLLEHAVRLLAARDRLVKVTQQSNPEREIEGLRERLQDAHSLEERQALETAMASRQMESQHVLQAKQGVDKIDAYLEQAQSTLAEIRTRLSLVAAGDAGAESDSVRDTLSQLKALSVTFEEAEQLFEGSR